MGVWIETIFEPQITTSNYVTPYVGVWIETQSSTNDANVEISHTLRGCVDWNIYHLALVIAAKWVTPYVGVWIETWIDWRKSLLWGVTPYVGVWIET